MQEELFRNNVTEGQGGIPLEIHYTVLDANCNPVVDAFIDIWHCKALPLSLSSSGNVLRMNSCTCMIEAGAIPFKKSL